MSHDSSFINYNCTLVSQKLRAGIWVRTHLSFFEFFFLKFI